MQTAKWICILSHPNKCFYQIQYVFLPLGFINETEFYQGCLSPVGTGHSQLRDHEETRYMQI